MSSSDSAASHSRLGSLLTASIVVAVLYGITCVQVFMYFRSNWKDHWVLKSAIATLYVLDTLHLGFISRAVYQDIIVSVNDPFALFQVPIILSLHVITWALSDLIVRCVFAHRIWGLSGNNRSILLIITTMSSLACMGYIAISGVMVFKKDLLTFTTTTWLAWTSFAFSACADLTIASSFCGMLWKKRTGIKKSDLVVRVLIGHSIVTAVLASLLTGISTALFTVMPENLLYLAFSFFPPKLLLNSVLVILNSRKVMQGMQSGLVSMHTDMLANSAAYRDLFRQSILDRVSANTQAALPSHQLCSQPNACAPCNPHGPSSAV